MAYEGSRKKSDGPSGGLGFLRKYSSAKATGSMIFVIVLSGRKWV